MLDAWVKLALLGQIYFSQREANEHRSRVADEYIVNLCTLKWGISYLIYIICWWDSKTVVAQICMA